MEAILGSSLGVFIGLTVILLGIGAFLAGQAQAGAWKPAWKVVFYMLLLGLGDRFLVFALFGGPLLSLSGYITHSLALVIIGLASYRLTKAHKMVSQYPWLYERAGLFGWRERAGA